MNDGPDRPPEPGAGDLYATLGIPTGASDDDITTAYRRLARQHHPDANPDAPSDAFSELTDAYDVLRDPERRLAYDRTRRARAEAARSAAKRIPIRHETPEQADASPTSAEREVELLLSFDQAALGTTAEITVDRDVPCRACDGAGRVAARPAGCPDCGGAGSTIRSSGGITIRTTCPRCEGSGRRPLASCSACAGAGRVATRRTITVRVPAGVNDGDRLRVPSPDGSGALHAIVRTEPHEFFGRRGDDITLRLPITVAEAALGGVLTVPTLTGAVAIRIPPGTPHGRTFRVRGHGIARSGAVGDLLVTVDIVVPTTLNDEQRAALEAFAAATDSPRARYERP